MTANLTQISRAEKRDIAQKIVGNLKARSDKGPAEPGLDDYIPELADVASALDTHVTNSAVADAQRLSRLARLDAADDQVDTLYRHLESYTFVEGKRRTGPNIALALALHDAAFPDGLAHVDDPVADENRFCRESLAVLRSPEQAATVQAIQVPLAWLDAWEAALDESDAAFADLGKARTDRKSAIDLGRDAESDWVELMVRLRRYVGSRAARGDVARIREGKELLAPLLDTLARLRTDAASRATRRRHANPNPAPPAPGPAGGKTPPNGSPSA